MNDDLAIYLCVCLYSVAVEPDLQRRNDHLQEPDIRGRPVTSRWRHSDVTTTIAVLYVDPCSPIQNQAASIGHLLLPTIGWCRLIINIMYVRSIRVQSGTLAVNAHDITHSRMETTLHYRRFILTRRRGVVVNTLVSINAVVLHLARLLPGRQYVTNHLGQISIPSLRGR